MDHKGATTDHNGPTYRSTVVAEPGMGSLTVSRRTGEWVGASSENRLVKTVSGRLGPLSSGVGQEVQRSIEEEALAPEWLSQAVSLSLIHI